jgi:GcrA cell cycle regulator
MEMLSNWNEERVQQLETLYREGKSFSLIGAAIGVSRNAAIGKAHRMHLPKRIEIIECKAYDHSKAIRSSPPRPRRTTFRAVAMPAEPEPEPLRLQLHDLPTIRFFMSLAAVGCQYAALSPAVL